MAMHAGRTQWTPVEAVAELVRAFGDGELDALSGRFVRAGTDTVESLQAATGQLQDPHDYLIASTQAALTTELTVAVRNKALEAFNDIMRMPV